MVGFEFVRSEKLNKRKSYAVWRQWPRYRLSWNPVSDMVQKTGNRYITLSRCIFAGQQFFAVRKICFVIDSISHSRL